MKVHIFVTESFQLEKRRLKQVLKFQNETAGYWWGYFKKKNLYCQEKVNSRVTLPGKCMSKCLPGLLGFDLPAKYMLSTTESCKFGLSAASLF